MDAKRFLTGTLVGGVTLFAVGFLVYGLALANALYTESPIGGLDARGLLSVMAQRLDVRTWRPVGGAAPVFRGVTTPGGNAVYGAAESDVMVAVRRSSQRLPLVWISADGAVAASVTDPQDPFTYAVSNDRTRIAAGGWGLFILDLERGACPSASIGRLVTFASHTTPAGLPGTPFLRSRAS